MTDGVDAVIAPIAPIPVFISEAIVVSRLDVGEVSQGVLQITVTIQEETIVAALYLTVVALVFDNSPVEMAQWMTGTVLVSHFHKLLGLVIFIGAEFYSVVFIGAEFDLRLGLGEKDKGQCTLVKWQITAQRPFSSLHLRVETGV